MWKLRMTFTQKKKKKCIKGYNCFRINIYLQIFSYNTQNIVVCMKIKLGHLRTTVQHACGNSLQNIFRTTAVSPKRRPEIIIWSDKCVFVCVSMFDDMWWYIIVLWNVNNYYLHHCVTTSVFAMMVVFVYNCVFDAYLIVM
jgi:hypothetical protein